MYCNGLGQRGSGGRGGASFGGGGFSSGVFASPSFSSFAGSRFASPFNVLPWDGWNNAWPWQTWYLYYPEYYPAQQMCSVPAIKLTQSQSQAIAAGQTIQVAVTNTCGQLVTVTLGGASGATASAAPAMYGVGCCSRSR